MDSTTRWQTRQKDKKMKQLERLKEFEYKNVKISDMGKKKTEGSNRGVKLIWPQFTCFCS
jgi:hypothetical protein